MAKKGKGRILIRLVSSAGTGHFYTTAINPKNIEGKVSLMKYDPKVRKHVTYNQEKIK